MPDSGDDKDLVDQPKSVISPILRPGDIPARSYWFPRNIPIGKRPGIRLIAGAGFLAPAGYFVALFFQLRGYVNITASRIDLIIATIFLVAFACVVGANFPANRKTVASVGSGLIILSAFALDRITQPHIPQSRASSPTPNPCPNGMSIMKNLTAISTHPEVETNGFTFNGPIPPCTYIEGLSAKDVTNSYVFNNNQALESTLLPVLDAQQDVIREAMKQYSGKTFNMIREIPTTPESVKYADRLRDALVNAGLICVLDGSSPSNLSGGSTFPPGVSIAGGSDTHQEMNDLAKALIVSGALKGRVRFWDNPQGPQAFDIVVMPNKEDSKE